MGLQKYVKGFERPITSHKRAIANSGASDYLPEPMMSLFPMMVWGLTVWQ